jgi:tetratricopeptide (TPR) repeat protein
MQGSSAIARDAAAQLAARVTPEMVRQYPFLEFQLPTRVLTLVRFGQWDAVLAEPAPPEDMHYTRGIWHFARGMAMLRTGRAAAADTERERMAAIRDSIPADQMFGMHSAKKLLMIGFGVLDGEAAAARGALDSATASLREAVRLEDSLVYDEPPPWFAPVRQSLGAMLLAAGRPAEAEQVYREDLRKHPRNGWSLLGLAKSLRAQGRSGDAASVEADFTRAWANADVTLSASVF